MSGANRHHMSGNDSKDIIVMVTTVDSFEWLQKCVQCDLKSAL